MNTINENNGTVKFYNHAKKFGFIKDDESGNDIFVHESGIVDAITEGSAVTYSVEAGKKGPNAVNVQLQ